MNRNSIAKEMFEHTAKHHKFAENGYKVGGWDTQKEFWQNKWRTIADWHIEKIQEAYDEGYTDGSKENMEED